MTTNYAGAAAETAFPVHTNNNGVTNNGNGSRTLKFRTNIPETVATRFADGIEKEGDYGVQLMFSLTDGRCMYLPRVAADQIKALGIQPREPFIVCKREYKEAGKRASTRYVIEKIALTTENIAQAAGPQRVADRPYNAAGIPSPATKIPMNVAVIEAVRMVQEAMKQTGEQWASEDRQGLVSTILISATREGWVGVWATTKEEAPPAEQPRPRTAGPKETAAAAGINTGGHPVGTQAAANFVRDQKLRELREMECSLKATNAREQEFVAFSTLSRAERIREFKKLAGQLPPDTFFKILEKHGVTDVTQFKGMNAATACHRALVEAAEAQRGLEADPSTYEHYAAGEDGAA